MGAFVRLSGGAMAAGIVAAVLGVLACVAFGLPRAGAAQLRSVSAPTPITDCSDDTQLRTDASTGGAYVFECSGTVQLSNQLVVTHDFSLSNCPTPTTCQSVTLLGSGSYLSTGNYYSVPTFRLFDVEGGTVSISGITLDDGQAGYLDTAGTAGSDGANGTAGADGTPGVVSDGGSGGSGTPGGDGGGGGAGTAVQGGAIYIATGATVALVGDKFDDNVAFGAAAGGGDGGFGGIGGSGGNAGCDSNYPPNCGQGGAGGDGGNGGNGGNGGAGASAEGGAVYVSPGAALTLQSDTFDDNEALSHGGPGGAGGYGLGGGPPGNYLYDGSVYQCGTDPGYPCNTTGSPGTNGNGAAGGSSATAAGGAIYNAGRLSGSAAFDDRFASGANQAISDGGAGGDAHPGGTGGNGGSAGNAAGGAIYTTTPICTSAMTFDTGGGQPNGVESSGGSGGAQGGVAGSDGTATGPDVAVQGGGSSSACYCPAPVPVDLSNGSVKVPAADCLLLHALWVSSGQSAQNAFLARTKIDMTVDQKAVKPTEVLRNSAGGFMVDIEWPQFSLSPGKHTVKLTITFTRRVPDRAGEPGRTIGAGSVYTSVLKINATAPAASSGPATPNPCPAQVGPNGEPYGTGSNCDPWGEASTPLDLGSDYEADPLPVPQVCLSSAARAVTPAHAQGGCKTWVAKVMGVSGRAYLRHGPGRKLVRLKRGDLIYYKDEVYVLDNTTFIYQFRFHGPTVVGGPDALNSYPGKGWVLNHAATLQFELEFVRGLLKKPDLRSWLGLEDIPLDKLVMLWVRPQQVLFHEEDQVKKSLIYSVECQFGIQHKFELGKKSALPVHFGSCLAPRG